MIEKLTAAIIVALILAGIAFAIWFRFFAPCDSIGWLPSSDIPGRCFLR
jgi:HAMP domain-containing protein